MLECETPEGPKTRLLAQRAFAPLGDAGGVCACCRIPSKYNLIARALAHAAAILGCCSCASADAAPEVVASFPRKELNMGEHTIIYQPQIIRETAEGLNRLDIRDEMLGRRELELMTPVDAESCATVIRGLLYLQHQDPEAPVTLYINSPGGEVQNGLALYDVMRIRDITATVIARHSGMSLERVFELTASDTYFEAKEAVEAGLADRIITRL